MKAKTALMILFGLVSLMALLAGLSMAQGQTPQAGAEPQADMGTAFTYQGRLSDGDGPVDGFCDLTFRLYDQKGSGEPPQGGTLLGTEALKGVEVQAGVFTVRLDFGAAAFGGEARWLEVELDCGAGTAVLSPRQELTAAPYALYARNGPFWSLVGNGGTDPTSHYLGTTDEVTLTLGVSGTAALRIEPAGDSLFGYSPNLIGGSEHNEVAAGVVGATIGGGGSARGCGAGPDYPDPCPNQVSGSHGTVSGGRANRVWAEGATVGGGRSNWATDQYATVGGGRSNRSVGDHATISGGFGNAATYPSSTVGGGWQNQATGWYATIGGGVNNYVYYQAATVGGGSYNFATGPNATVSGGGANDASALYATISGGRSNVISDTADYAAIPGGCENYTQGRLSFAAGTQAQALHDGTFVWAGCGDDCANPLNATPFASTHDNQFLVRADGGVKVVKETSTFSSVYAALHVESAADGGEAAWLRQTHSANPHPVLKVLKHPDSSANFVEGANRSNGSETPKFHINAAGTFVAGSDFAEALPAMDDGDGYEPGDVLVLSAALPGAVERCSQPYDGAVVGVYSTRPGLLGADKEGATEVWPGEIPVAVVGIVPVKVSAENGSIQPGDLLTTSATLGHAMRCQGVELCFGRTLGKALEPWQEGTGTIKMLVMLQ